MSTTMGADDLAKQSPDKAKAESPPLASEPDSKPVGVPALARFQSRGRADEQDKQTGSATIDNKSKPENKAKLKVRTFSNKKNPSGRASSFDNAITAIDQLSIDCRYDVFHDRMLVSGHPLQIGTDENLDSVALMIRRLIVDTYRFDPGQQNTLEAIKSRCLDNLFDPVADYLASLRWDGVQRIDTWLMTHLGADDNPLNRSIGRKMLIAAVRRARQPGCKFDYIIVWDNSRQGAGKSSVILVLAGEENFSDQDILMLSSQEQQELIQGVWLYELGELSGLAKADINKVKSFASRQFDRARPAYGRNRVDRPRRCVFIGTTNDPEYLQDPTGNRRFWPLTPGSIDLEAVRRDRNQLWAEAAAAEATGEPLIIPEELWPAIEDRQNSRMISDPWEDLLTNVERVNAGDNIVRVADPDGKPEWRAKTSFLLANILGIPSERVNTTHSRRLGAVMRKLGWTGPKNLRFGADQAKGYFKAAKAAAAATATDATTCYR